MGYKVIDGVLYKAVDTSEIKQKVDSVVKAIRPYKDGIKQCEEQIAEYNKQISAIVEDSGLDPEVVKAIDPEKADFLGL